MNNVIDSITDKETVKEGLKELPKELGKSFLRTFIPGLVYIEGLYNACRRGISKKTHKEEPTNQDQINETSTNDL